MILVVDMNWKQESLSKNEFVLPIISVVEPLEACVVKHYLDVEPSELGKYKGIILSGTTLKDFEAQKHLDRFNWIKTYDKPILGICAGMQVISLVYGIPLTTCMHIGMTEIATIKANPIFDGDFSAYALHTLSVKPSETFVVLAKSSKCIQAIKHKQKPIYGILFHPEVRNFQILKHFIALA